MKIVQIPNAYAPVIGGTELTCRRISECLAGMGHEVVVITANVASVGAYYALGHAPASVRRERIGGVEVIRLPYGWRGVHALGAFVRRGGSGLGPRLAGACMSLIRRQFTASMAKAIRRARPDVVIAMPHLVVNVQAALECKRRLAFPLVMAPMLHEHFATWPAKEMKAALVDADAVVAVTENEAERLVSAYRVPEERVFVTSAGVDLGDEEPSREPRPADVLFIGRKVPTKGIDLLLEAMRLVWARFPDTRLILAGARAPDTVEIDRSVAALASTERRLVTSLDAISEEEKHELLRSCRCLVLPSAVESFGLVLLEAWARGTPVVTLDLPVFRCTVTDGEDGLLVAAGDSRALAAGLVRLLEDAVLAARLGYQGYLRARSHHAWKQVSERYLAACNHALSSNSRCRQRVPAAPSATT